MDVQMGRAPGRRAAAFSVHLFTASGGAVALLALYAAIERDFPKCFAWLGLALFIDGVDGTLARFAKVTEIASAIDGVILDLVVDFLTYVLVPVVAIWRSDLMPPDVAFWLGLLVTFASALYFADSRMKTGDYWFRGFPALWNVVALYLFVLRPPWLVNAGLLIAGEDPARDDHRGLHRVFRAGGRGDRAGSRGLVRREARLSRGRRLFLRAAAAAPFALGGKLSAFVSFPRVLKTRLASAPGNLL